MKIGILGSGKIVPDFLQAAALVPQAEIVALAARNERQRTALAERFGISMCYAHAADLLGDPEVEAVYIALPNSLHGFYTRCALESGKHVLLEKPATASGKEWRELFTLAQSRGLCLFEMITNRFHPMFRQVQEWLPEIGPVRIVQMNYSQFSSRYKRFLAGDIAPAFDPTLGGGALLDLNVYNIQLAAGWFGKPEDVRYFPNVSQKVDTSGVLVLSYPGFQCICTGAKDCAAPAGFQIEGENGCILCTCPPNEPDAVSLSLQNGKNRTFSPTLSGVRLEPELTAICQSFSQGSALQLAAAMTPASQITADILETALKQAGLSAGIAPKALF